MLSLLLAACGEQNPALTDKNYDVPAYTGTNEIPDLSSNTDLQDKLWKDSKANFNTQTLKVYSTAAALSDTKSWFLNEMIKKGWVDKSFEVLSNNSLSSNGWVQAFVKDDRIVTVIMIGVGARKDGVLKDFTAQLPTDGNILLVMQAIYKQGGGTAPTPAK
jgi:hypothetical protein